MTTRTLTSPNARFDLASPDGAVRARIVRQGSRLVAAVLWDGGELGQMRTTLWVDIDEIQRRLAAQCLKVARSLAKRAGLAGDYNRPRLRDKLTLALEAIAGDELADDEVVGFDDGDEELVGRVRIATRTERRKARAARKAKRKRGVSRFKRALQRAAKAIARSKLVAKLRGIWQGIWSGKLVNKALKVAGPALGMAFGGPMGAMMGAQLGGALTASKLEQSGELPKSSAQDLYRLGCGCG